MRKSLITLVVLAVVLLLAYLLMSQSEKRAMAPNEQANFVGIDSGIVNRITISRFGDQVEFQKSGDGWTVLDAGKQQRAEKATVDQIANAAHNLIVGEIISSNPEKQMLFQVDTLMGKSVSFYQDEKELGRMIVGKAGTDFRSTYVRKPESEDVYLAGTALTRLLERPARGYRDKIVNPFDTSTVAMIRVMSKDFEYAIVRIDSVWSIQSDKAGTFIADHSKALQLLGMLGNLRVADFVNEIEMDTTSMDNAQDRIVVRFMDTSSDTIAIKMRSETTKDYYLRISPLDDLFIIYEGARNSMMKKPEEYKSGAA